MISYRSHFLGGREGEDPYLNFIKIKHNYNAVPMSGEEAGEYGKDIITVHCWIFLVREILPYLMFQSHEMHFSLGLTMGQGQLLFLHVPFLFNENLK
jgi:hypothetical protein